jgi:hypothetical protein
VLVSESETEHDKAGTSQMSNAERPWWTHEQLVYNCIQACAPSHGHTPSLGQHFVLCFRTCLMKADSIYSASVTNAASFGENTASLRTLESKSLCHRLHRRQQG